MVGEDFGIYGRTPKKVPIGLICLGSTNPDLMRQLKLNGQKAFPLHSPKLNPDYKNTIETGIQVIVGNVIGLMSKNM